MTREVAAFPPGADLDSFGWRVSLAEVRQAGAFSQFPGVDRTLAVLQGRLVLRIEGQDAIELTSGDAAIRFPGDTPTVGEPIGGPVLDLNVMTRRETHQATMAYHAAPVGDLRLEAPVTIILARAALRIAGPDWIEQLGPWDALMIETPTRTEIQALEGSGGFHLIELRELPQP